MTGLYRYVTHDRVDDYMRLGWLWCAPLGRPHGEWSCLMRWLCSCDAKEPRA